MGTKGKTKSDALVRAFVNELGAFSYELSSADHVWRILFPESKAGWQYLHVTKYRETFYLTHVNGDGRSLEFEGGRTVRAVDIGLGGTRCSSEDPARWAALVVAAHRWLGVVRRDWIGANRRVQSAYPLDFRCGIVPNAVVRAVLPDVYRLDRELGDAKTRALVRLVEQGFFRKAENMEVATMTAADYFKCCRIAYLAGKRKEDTVDASLSGREMYARYADGRHEGLLDINPASALEFAAWLDGTHPKRSHGGHPWEIKRGGNTTHIDLSVSRPSLHNKERFQVELRGESIGRMVETMRMFLAIHDAGLPIAIANPESVRMRLLGQDNIGIVPSYDLLHRADQRFANEKHVFDVMHYADLGRFKRRLAPFIAWEPLPILTPV
jgi:hypothetical protein